LLLAHDELNVIGLIGIILLIGIVKKNAIMMIDFALETERTAGKSPRDSIYEPAFSAPSHHDDYHGCTFGRPAAGTWYWNRIRTETAVRYHDRGGLIVSQALTLFTTPVVYLYLDRFG